MLYLATKGVLGAGLSTTTKGVLFVSILRYIWQNSKRIYHIVQEGVRLFFVHGDNK